MVGTSMGASTIWSYIELFGNLRLAKAVFVDQAPLQVTVSTWQCTVLSPKVDAKWQMQHTYSLLASTVCSDVSAPGPQRARNSACCHLTLQHATSRHAFDSLCP